MSEQNEEKSAREGEVVKALENNLNTALQKENVQITDAEKPYRIKSLTDGKFDAEEIGTDGQAIPESLTQFPCNQHYLSLVLAHWFGTTTATENTQAMAAGGGGSL